MRNELILEEITDKRLSTGALSLDIRLGGGLQRGTITELYGVPSSGKSSIVLTMIAETQRRGGTAVIIDANRSFDTTYARANGVDLDALHYVDERQIDKVVDLLVPLLQNKAADLVVLDDLASMVVREFEPVDADPVSVTAEQNRLAERLSYAVSNSDTSLLIVNEVRANLFGGNNLRTPGGRLLKYFIDRRIQLDVGPPIREGINIVGRTVKCKVQKARGLIPFASTYLPLYRYGIDYLEDAIGLAVRLGIIVKTGGWYQYQSMNANGLTAAKTFLSENIDVWRSLENSLKSQLSSYL